jgi:hypothetical protein
MNAGFASWQRLRRFDSRALRGDLVRYEIPWRILHELRRAGLEGSFWNSTGFEAGVFIIAGPGLSPVTKTGSIGHALCTLMRYRLGERWI